MKIEVTALEKFLPVYVSAITTATLASTQAAALGRELTAEEIDEAAERVAGSTLDFMRGYSAALQSSGVCISEEEFTTLHQEIYNAVFYNAWELS